MVIQETDQYIKACMKTWMFCESCIHSENDRPDPRKELIEKCRACANSCFAVVCRIINNSEELQESVLSCFLDCRECYTECDKYAYNEDIQYCGEICLFCADTVKDLLVLVNPN
jgi:hypothetical protein